MRINQPNILLIISDHLSPRVIGAYGETESCTPHIDRVAEGGALFGNAYANCPLCQPSRASFWTGRYPHETRVLSNGNLHVNGPLPDDLVTLGDVFSRGGYEAIHFGKEHDFGTLRGFERVPTAQKKPEREPHPAWPENHDTWLDNDSAEKCARWLEQPHERPFLAVADLHNPHNICGWVGENDSLDGPVENIPPPCELPLLPDNFHVEDMDTRPPPIQYLCCTHNRLAQAAGWTEDNYRHYIAAYRHYAALADEKIGLMLQALKDGGALDSTVIVITADHGDGMASHGMATKAVSMYDETMRVPWVMAGPGIPHCSDSHPALIQLLDLMPTLLDIAGLDTPEAVRGNSVLPLLHGEIDELHEYVAGEWYTEWGFTISPGRMIRTKGYKYTRYLEGNAEELYDMRADPGETRNLAPHPEHSETLQRHREILSDHLCRTGDPFDSLEVKVDPRWRSHALGYRHHKGLSAPMARQS